MPLPVITTSDFENSVEAEYPIGKYKSGEYKLCYICKEQFNVGELYINSSKMFEERRKYRQSLEDEFGKEVADYRVKRLGKVKSVLVHCRCEPYSNKVKNLIYSPHYSCIYTI